MMVDGGWWMVDGLGDECLGSSSLIDFFVKISFPATGIQGFQWLHIPAAI